MNTLAVGMFWPCPSMSCSCQKQLQQPSMRPWENFSVERDFLVAKNQGFYSTVYSCCVGCSEKKRALPVPAAVTGCWNSGCSGRSWSSFLVSSALCQDLGQFPATPEGKQCRGGLIPPSLAQYHDYWV